MSRRSRGTPSIWEDAAWRRASCWRRRPRAASRRLSSRPGPFQGTGLAGAGRHAVVGRSPKSGWIADSYVGGFVGHELGRSGYDGILIRGVSAEPSYLLMEDGRAELRPADDLWGMNTAEVTELLNGRHVGARVATIGPAGEREVQMACIMHDTSRAAGRPGFGAVMGAGEVEGDRYQGLDGEAARRRKGVRRSPRTICQGARRGSRTEDARLSGNLARHSWTQRDRDPSDEEFPWEASTIGPRRSAERRWRIRSSLGGRRALGVRSAASAWWRHPLREGRWSDATAGPSMRRSLRSDRCACAMISRRSPWRINSAMPWGSTRFHAALRSPR